MRNNEFGACIAFSAYMLFVFMSYSGPDKFYRFLTQVLLLIPYKTVHRAEKFYWSGSEEDERRLRCR